MFAGDANLPAMVRVSAPGRLHLGFLDLNGGLGRRFGSLGLTLERPLTRVTLRRAGARRVSGPDGERAAATLDLVAGRLGLDGRVEITIEDALPPHQGLGSGTQLRLAVAAGLAALNGIERDARTLGRLIGRGQRSAIGIGAFAAGGLILDGGRGPGDEPPPVISRLSFPPQWRILIVSDRSVAGLSGSRETRAIGGLPHFPAELAGTLCRLVLMQALPAVAEGDLAAFGAAVAEIQRRLGDHFAAAQGGRFTSAAVGSALQWVEAQGGVGIGQSSWGPTGFAFLPDEAAGSALLKRARARWRDLPALSFDLVRGRNRGAVIDRFADAMHPISEETE